MANNSSGARSVLYGKTIDHVLEQHVVLSDGRVTHVRAAGTARAGRHVRRTTARRRRATGRSGAGAVAAPTEIERRFPKVLRRVGGYNLDAFVDPATPVQPGAADRRLRGHARRRPRSEDRAWCRCRRPRRCWPIQFDRSARGARRDAGDPAARAVGRRGDGRLHPRPHAAERRRSTRCAGAFIEGDPGGAALRRVLRRSTPTSCRRGSRRSSATCARAGFGYRYTAPSTSPRRRASGACAKRRSACRWR